MNLNQHTTNRREFLKTTGMAAFAPALGMLPTPPSVPPPTPTSTTATAPQRHIFLPLFEVITLPMGAAPVFPIPMEPESTHEPSNVHISMIHYKAPAYDELMNMLESDARAVVMWSGLWALGHNPYHLITHQDSPIPFLRTTPQPFSHIFLPQKLLPHMLLTHYGDCNGPNRDHGHTTLTDDDVASIRKQIKSWGYEFDPRIQPIIKVEGHSRENVGMIQVQRHDPVGWGACDGQHLIEEHWMHDCGIVMLNHKYVEMIFYIP